MRQAHDPQLMCEKRLGALTMLGLRSLLCVFLVCSIGMAGSGCRCGSNGMSAKQRWSDAPVIPEKDLPDGWRMPPSSEMPPSDKMPWWQENPFSLRGTMPDELRVGDRPTGASQVRGATYEKDGFGVIILTFAYTTQERAEAEYGLMRKDGPPRHGLLGWARHRENVIVFIGWDRDCPDQDYFDGYFRAIAREGP